MLPTNDIQPKQKKLRKIFATDIKEIAWCSGSSIIFGKTSIISDKEALEKTNAAKTNAAIAAPIDRKTAPCVEKSKNGGRLRPS